MSDFSKVHGPAAQATNLDFLRREVVRLANQNAQLNQELLNRAGPRFAEVMDAVLVMTNFSKSGNAGARQNLKRFFEILDDARSEAIALTVVRHDSNGNSDQQPPDA